ncbi:thioredoxin-domain-containing protein [Trametes maxima]|nr:thioredoxin-domain-containing protein [Trametes maxima]
MKLFSLARLSFTLLTSSVILASAADPVESTETELLVLTPDNFGSTISEGVWFVKHFSPYCGHCRNFAPTWKQLVEQTESKPDPGIHLAQVNCAVNGDLCRKNGIDGYPRMNLYRNGKYVETFKKSHTIEILTATPAIEKGEHVEKVCEPDVNSHGTVLSLDEKTFPRAADEGGVFIKFFAPRSGHCKKLTPTWVQLAADMRKALEIAEVNCGTHDGWCKKEGVSGYPMLFYYGGKGTKTEYTDGRKIDQLKAFANKVSGPGVQELGFGELEAKVAEHPNQVIEASHILIGSPPLYTSTASTFYDHFNLEPGTAALVVLKDNEPNVPAAIYPIPRPVSTADERQALVDWLFCYRLPTVLELDSDNFQDVMAAPHKPLVVAAPAPDLPRAAREVGALAQQWHDACEAAPVVFVWMDADKWGKWRKGMYGVVPVEGGPLQAVVANHTGLVYYDTDQFGERIQLTPASLFPAINGAAKGTIPYKHCENVVERLARYLINKLVSVETYVSENPWYTASYAVVALGVLGLGLKHLIADRDDSREGGYLRKQGRLD